MTQIESEKLRSVLKNDIKERINLCRFEWKNIIEEMEEIEAGLDNKGIVELEAIYSDIYDRYIKLECV